MRAPLVFGLFAAAVLLAGCVGAPATGGAEVSPAAEDPAPRPEESRAPSWSPPADPPLVKRDVPVALEVVDPWVRPRQAFDAVANASPGSRVAWYASAEGGDAFVVPIAGFLYLGGAHPANASDIAHAHAPPSPPHVPVATGGIPSGESTRGFAFTKEGRYVLGVDASRRALVNVTVNASESARDVAHVTLLEDAHGLRFAPSELAIHPQTLVRFWNAAPVAVEVRETRFYVAVPLADAVAQFLAVDPGRYELLVVARDGAEGWGEARAPLVIDFESPLARVAVGPFDGRISSVPTPDAPTSREHRFEAAHPLRSLSLNLSSASSAPTPHALEWVLMHEGAEVARGMGDGEETIPDLPAGEYVLQVRAAEGVLVSYHVRGEAHHRLRAPEPASDPS